MIRVRGRHGGTAGRRIVAGALDAAPTQSAVIVGPQPRHPGLELIERPRDREWMRSPRSVRSSRTALSSSRARHPRGKADAVSPGNTARCSLRACWKSVDPGVRGPLPVTIPHVAAFRLLDSGANADARPETSSVRTWHVFAERSSAFKSRIRLLSIGESREGNQLALEPRTLAASSAQLCRYAEGGPSEQCGRRVLATLHRETSSTSVTMDDLGSILETTQRSPNLGRNVSLARFSTRSSHIPRVHSRSCSTRHITRATCDRPPPPYPH